MTVNVPLLRKAVEWVEEQAQLPADERQWNQDFWFTAGCETSFCIAGYIAQQNGWTPLFDGQVETCYVVKGGRKEFASVVADEILDLEPGHTLYLGTNTAREIRWQAEELAEESL